MSTTMDEGMFGSQKLQGMGNKWEKGRERKIPKKIFSPLTTTSLTFSNRKGEFQMPKVSNSFFWPSYFPSKSNKRNEFSLYFKNLNKA